MNPETITCITCTVLLIALYFLVNGQERKKILKEAPIQYPERQIENDATELLMKISKCTTEAELKRCFALIEVYQRKYKNSLEGIVNVTSLCDYWTEQHAKVILEEIKPQLQIAK